VDKEEVKRILAPYCPPLTLSQTEAIAEEIVKASKKPVAVTTGMPEPEAPAKPVHAKASRKEK